MRINKNGDHLLDNHRFAEAGGFEPPVRLPVRQFSKLLVSATHPNFQVFMTAAIILELRCKGKSYFLINNTFGVFFRKKDTNFVAESENQFIKYI